jgi:hypothetical protein
MLLDESGPSNSPEFYHEVFMGTPISQPTPLGTATTRTKNPDGTTSMQMLALDTLASRAGPSPPYHHLPPGAKLAKKQALSEHTELSMFDILNIFWCHWFLSAGHLWAQALLAQKADNGKFVWVKFTPQFHTHLVKYTVVLVPQPISKVKKVMFIYILVLLNEDSHQAFFDLTKGNQWATTAQKEKKWLAWKRNHASRQECWKQAEEAVDGLPQWKCDFCGWKFASHKTVKRHQCPLAKGASRGTGAMEGKSRRIAPSFPCKLNKLAANPPPPSSSTPSGATALQPRKKHTWAPSSACDVALATMPHEPLDRVFASLTPAYRSTSTCTSERLNTSKKCRIQRGLMESIDAVGQQ